jgi:hypothetical protein
MSRITRLPSIWLYPLDPGDQAARFNIELFAQRAFERKSGEFHHLGTDVATQARVGFLKTDDTAQLELDRTG